MERKTHNESSDLLELIQAAKYSSCDDPRDLVFHLQPIASSGLPGQDGIVWPPPRTKYSNTVAKVFVDAARYIIRNRQDLSLWRNERPPCAKGLRDLPSWCPDWSSFVPPASSTLPCESEPYAWATEILRDSDTTALWVDQDLGLRVDACVLDCIIRISPIITPANLEEVCHYAYRWTVDQITLRTLCRTLLLYPTRIIPPDQPSEHDFLPQFTASLSAFIAQQEILRDLTCTKEQYDVFSEVEQAVRDDQQLEGYPRVLDYEHADSFLFVGMARNVAIGRKFFVTAQGCIGMTAIEGTPLINPASQGHASRKAAQPASESSATADACPSRLKGARVGDVVAVLQGGCSPYILRPVGLGYAKEADSMSSRITKRYNYIGDCYVNGDMRAEPFIQRRQRTSEIRREQEGDDTALKGVDEDSGIEDEREDSVVEENLVGDEGRSDGGLDGLGPVYDSNFVRIVLV